MLSSSSVWERGLIRKTRSAAFSLKDSSVSFTFGDRVTGRVTYATEPRNLNKSRQEIIDKEYGEKTLNGYKYKSISHTYIRPTVLEESLEVLSHGVPVKQSWENCSMLGITCMDGVSNTKCNSGKCVIGRLVKEEATDKWKYESYSVPGLYYYVYGRESVELYSVMRGEFILPGGINSIPVHRIASPKSTVYLPPSSYSGETFTRRVINFAAPESSQDSVNIFIRSILRTEFFATEPVQRKLLDRVVEVISVALPFPWSEVVENSLKEAWYGGNFTNREFLVKCYEELFDLYKKGIQVSGSSFNRSEVTIDNNIARPIYNRLPGVSGAYNTEENPSNVSSWLVSGADMELSRSKYLIDSFYRVFLDPETCYPANLDWIAQHMGFFGGMWNLGWDINIKRLLLRNAHKNDLIPDGITWTNDPEESTLHRIDFSFIENEAIPGERYVEKVYDDDTELVSFQAIDSTVADISEWPGLIPSRASKVGLLFMFWAFGIKAVNPDELESISGGGYKVKSGLRSLEFDSPVNMPVTYDVLHVGSESDAEINNYPNQLIADIGVCYDVNKSNTIVLRMPFYYNRNGISWDTAESIMKNWAPGTATKRIQYGYAVADLLCADDILFTP